MLLLTARDAVADRVAGLEAGADDYLVKPFAVEELLARAGALIRRRGTARAGVLAVGALRLDPVARAVRRDGRGDRADRARGGAAGAAHARPAHGRARASGRSTRSGARPPSRTSSTATSASLRRKLGGPGLIRTVRGVGFVLEP